MIMSQDFTAETAAAPSGSIRSLVRRITRQAALEIKRHAHLIAGVADYKAPRADDPQPATEILARIEARKLIDRADGERYPQGEIATILQVSCLRGSTVRSNRKINDIRGFGLWLRRRQALVAGFLDRRERAERAIATRYEGCRWSDSIERALIDEIVDRGLGRW
jgi:hypothetical protein